LTAVKRNLADSLEHIQAANAGERHAGRSPVEPYDQSSRGRALGFCVRSTND
jgi:hypothetical protein